MRIRIARQVVFFLVLFCPGALFSSDLDVQRMFDAGNRHYTEGNYKAAIEAYMGVVKSGFENEIVFYNLGNAYFRDQQLGLAILYYEKASQWAPRDRDIAGNLQFARARMVDKVEAPPQGPVLRLLARAVNFLPLDLQTWVSVCLFLAANGCFSWALLASVEATKRLAWKACLGSLATFLVIGGVTAARISEAANLHEAVILSEEASVLSGPGQDNPVLFAVHEGLKVRVQTELNDWAQVTLENGWNGWVKKESLGRI